VNLFLNEIYFSYFAFQKIVKMDYITMFIAAEMEHSICRGISLGKAM
jgi:hypothetical protein